MRIVQLLAGVGARQSISLPSPSRAALPRAAGSENLAPYTGVYMSRSMCHAIEAVIQPWRRRGRQRAPRRPVSACASSFNTSPCHCTELPGPLSVPVVRSSDLPARLHAAQHQPHHRGRPPRCSRRGGAANRRGGTVCSRPSAVERRRASACLAGSGRCDRAALPPRPPPSPQDDAVQCRRPW